MVTSSVCIWSHIQIVFVVTEHDYAVEISRFKHGVKLQGMVNKLLGNALDPLFLGLSSASAQNLFLHLLID